MDGIPGINGTKVGSIIGYCIGIVKDFRVKKVKLVCEAQLDLMVLMELK